MNSGYVVSGNNDTDYYSTGQIYTDNTSGTLWQIWHGDDWVQFGINESIAPVSPVIKRKRKEGLTVKRQTFIEALMDEGIALTAAERKLIYNATSDEFELFLARVMIRGKFGKDMLDVLRPEPQTVIVKREE